MRCYYDNEYDKRMINYVMCNEDKFKVTYKGVGIYLVCIYISILMIYIDIIPPLLKILNPPLRGLYN